jgi:hypothetical protein
MRLAKIMLSMTAVIWIGYGARRSYRRWPERGKHSRIVLWFRGMTPAGGHS